MFQKVSKERNNMNFRQNKVYLMIVLLLLSGPFISVSHAEHSITSNNDIIFPEVTVSVEGDSVLIEGDGHKMKYPAEGSDDRWQEHIESVAWEDLDGDGEDELIVAVYFQGYKEKNADGSVFEEPFWVSPVVYICEVDGGSATIVEEEMVGLISGFGLEVVLIDVDGDGLKDVAAKGTEPSRFHMLKILSWKNDGYAVLFDETMVSEEYEITTDDVGNAVIKAGGVTWRWEGDDFVFDSGKVKAVCANCGSQYQEAIKGSCPHCRNILIRLED